MILINSNHISTESHFCFIQSSLAWNADADKKGIFAFIHVINLLTSIGEGFESLVDNCLQYDEELCSFNGTVAVFGKPLRYSITSLYYNESFCPSLTDSFN